MSFTEIQEQQRSEKFLLVRIRPTKYINNLLTEVGPALYSMTFMQPISSVRLNNVTLTRVESIYNALQFYHNEMTGEFILSLASPITSTNVLTLSYYLFFTEGRTRIVHETPEIDTTALREWEPRIKGISDIGQDVSNILSGVLSITGSSLTLINNDFYLNQFVSDNDSFQNKEITIWHCLDDISNIRKIFKGRCSNVSISREEMQISFKDSFAVLSSQALCGDSNPYLTKLSYPDVDPSKEGNAIPIILAKDSRYKLRSSHTTSYALEKEIDSSSLNDAACISYSDTISTSTNRIHVIARVPVAQDMSFTTTAINHFSDYSILTLSTSYFNRLTIGDCFSATTGYHRIIGKIYPNQIVIKSTANFSGNGASNYCPVLILTKNDINYFLMPARDYTTTALTTDAGNRIIRVTLVNNFEANHSIDPYDPTIDKLGYRVKVDNTTVLHNKVLKYLIEKAGISTDATSFASAETLLPVNCAFQIPKYDEIDFGKYFDYCEEILKSTLGLLYLTPDYTMGYKLIQTLSAASDTTDTDILRDTFGIDLSYDDIRGQVIAYNPHLDSTEYPLSSESRKNLVTQYLHGVIDTDKMVHVLEDISRTIDMISSIKSNRQAIYNYSTKQINYLSEVGDQTKLKKSGLLGDDSERNVMFFGLNKSANKTIIKAIDLLGV